MNPTVQNAVSVPKLKVQQDQIGISLGLERLRPSYAVSFAATDQVALTIDQAHQPFANECIVFNYQDARLARYFGPLAGFHFAADDGFGLRLVCGLAVERK